MDLCTYIELILNRPEVSDEQAENCLKRIVKNYFRNEHLFKTKIKFTPNKLNALKSQILVDYIKYLEVDYENPDVICSLGNLDENDTEFRLQILLLHEWGYQFYNDLTMHMFMEEIHNENV